jgi:Domain of unknown function (DUF4386)
VVDDDIGGDIGGDIAGDIGGDIGDDLDDDLDDGEDGRYIAPPARYEKLGAGAGVAYALVGFVGSSLLPVAKVGPEDTAAAIAKQLLADRGRVSAGVLLTMLSLFFFLVFLSCLHRWLRDVEGEEGWFATLALVGGALMAGMLLVVVMLAIASTVLAGYGPDPVVARTILVLEWQAIPIAFIPAAAFIGGTGLVGYTTGALPRWLAISGLVIAIGLLVPPLAFLPFLLSTLWTGMLAIFLLQRTRLGF